MRTYNQIVRSVYGGNRSAFWSGFASVLDRVGPAQKPQQPVRLRPASEALAEDWSQVSHDLERAFHRAGCR